MKFETLCSYLSETPLCNLKTVSRKKKFADFALKIIKKAD